MRKLLVLALGMLIGSVAVAQRQDKLSRESEPDVYFVDSEDAAMRAAIQKARSSFSDFSKAMKDSENEAFAVKIPLTGNGETEHMWLSAISRSGGKWKGILANVPVFITEVKMGDEIEFKPEQISDWYYIRDKKIYGAYSLRLFRNKMSITERQEFDDALGVVFD